MTIEIDNDILDKVLSAMDDRELINAITESTISEIAKSQIIETWIRELPPFHLYKIAEVLKEELPG